jgi:phosphoglycolate phosphatase-like HAD superfamily hydrolase
MLRIITDFDGPIIDVSERYYRVYQFCLAETRRANQPVRELSKSEFWRLKRARVPERKIGQRSGLDEHQAKQFARLRRDTVHRLPNLIHDGLVPGAVEALERLQQAGAHIVVMTMRKERELSYALDQHDLRRFFPVEDHYCLPDDHVKTTDVQEKPILMQRAIAELSAADSVWMVGDTEADIVAAQSQEIPVIALLSGIRDRNSLAEHNPDYIVDDLNAAADLILQRSCVLSSS